MSTITTDPGRLKAEYVTIKQLIGYAYDVSPLVIAGNAPARGFDVEGKAEGVHSRAELRLMLQDLLANRFGLRLHHETRILTVDALVVGKSPKLQASEVTEPDPRGFHLHSGKLPGHVAVEGQTTSMPGLANYLSTHHASRGLSKASRSMIDLGSRSKATPPAAARSESRATHAVVADVRYMAISRPCGIASVRAGDPLAISKNVSGRVGRQLSG